MNNWNEQLSLAQSQIMGLTQTLELILDQDLTRFQ